MRTLALLLFLSVTINANAKVWRVNNSLPMQADVTQPGLLFDGTNTTTNPEASAGDTIYIEPSSSEYSGFTINKNNITVMGNGYFLDLNPGLQANTQTSKVYSISLQSSGSSLSGLDINTIYLVSSDITISRCFINSVQFYYSANASNIKINKCFINGGIYDYSSAGLSVSNVFFENNIFSKVANNNSFNGLNLSNKISGLIRNNIFNYCGNFLLYNFYVSNNIFINNVNFGNNTNSGNNVYRNNLFSYNNSSTYPTVYTNNAPNQNNQFGVNMANVFKGTPNNTWNGTTTFNDCINTNGSTNTESRFELKAGSPAIGAGESGTTIGGATVTNPDCGAYGATDPYRKAGLPNIPSIYNLVVPATVSAGGTMPVSVSSRSNN